MAAFGIICITFGVFLAGMFGATIAVFVKAMRIANFKNTND